MSPKRESTTVSQLIACYTSIAFVMTHRSIRRAVAKIGRISQWYWWALSIDDGPGTL